MGVTVQVRNLDANVQQRLRAAAEREGLSLSAFLRRELTRLAARSEAVRAHNRLGVSENFFVGISPDDIVAMVREDRDR
jgi:plasmid stability protein